MGELDKFKENIERIVGGAKQAQLRFVVCNSVDWNEKNMSAVGVSDDVPYEGVQLGFGYTDIKPAKDSICLIGILEGKEALTFLINAENVELVEIKAKQIVYNEGKNGGLILIEKLIEKINQLEDKLKDHQHGYIPYPSGMAGTPVSTTLASALIPVPDTTLVFNNTERKEIENEKITH